MSDRSTLGLIWDVLSRGALLAAGCAITWSFLGFGIAGRMRGTASETVGYIQVVLLPIGMLLGFLTGAVLGWMGSPKIRMWVALGALTMLALAIDLYLAASARH